MKKRRYVISGVFLLTTALCVFLLLAYSCSGRWQNLFHIKKFANQAAFYLYFPLTLLLIVIALCIKGKAGRTIAAIPMLTLPLLQWGDRSFYTMLRTPLRMWLRRKPIYDTPSGEWYLIIAILILPVMIAGVLLLRKKGKKAFKVCCAASFLAVIFFFILECIPITSKAPISIRNISQNYLHYEHLELYILLQLPLLYGVTALSLGDGESDQSAPSFSSVFGVILGILCGLVGMALSVWWMISDIGWGAVFERSAIIIGWIPIPGQLFGIVIQLIPAIIGIVGGISLYQSMNK